MSTNSKNTTEPTSAHHARIHALITSLEQKRAELSTTCRKIRSLRQTKELLRSEITSTENLLLRMQPQSRTAVFNIPELLQLIFSFTQSFTGTDTRSFVCAPISYDQPASRLPPPPISIARVCKQWRRTALATTTLWSRIFIDTSGHTKSTCAPYLRRLGLYLSRSGRQPLIVSIEGNTRDVVGPFFFRLRAHEERWRVVRMKICSDLMEAFLPLSPPVLTALELSDRWYDHDDHDDADEFEPPPSIVSRSHSSIRSLSVNVSWVFKEAGFPWHHLCALHVQISCWSFPMEVLEWCRQLEFLSITQEYKHEVRQPFGRDLVHTRLERLELMDNQAVLVFHELSLPSLRSLKFDAISCNDTDAHDFVQFISRSPSLTTLRIIPSNWQRSADSGEFSGDEHARELLDITSATVQVLEIDMWSDVAPLSFLNFFGLSHLATHFPSLQELRLGMIDLHETPGIIHALLKLDEEMNDANTSKVLPMFSKIILLIEDKHWTPLVKAATPTSITISNEELSDWSRPGDFVWRR
ncbi:hypothetical protein DL96DRAFT_506937 [Flagelloscypha sp. PMI_526]|nr:hypothetical protein DL96DRAFT_506937 [Flagelloscypha sp. PMI_526]